MPVEALSSTFAALHNNGHSAKTQGINSSGQQTAGQRPMCDVVAVVKSLPLLCVVLHARGMYIIKLDLVADSPSLTVHHTLLKLCWAWCVLALAWARGEVVQGAAEGTATEP